MPLNLACFAPHRAAEVMAASPGIETWAIGGYSRDGTMAASFAHSSPDALRGLVLWAVCPAGSDDLSGQRLAAGSVHGTQDGLASEDKMAASRLVLPPDTDWIATEGAVMPSPAGTSRSRATSRRL
jgi:hypothetical protein